MSEGRWVVAAAIAVAAVVLAGRLARASEQERPVRVTLKAETTIGGVPCAAGYAWRFADGRLGRCTLARAASVNGAQLPARTTVAFEGDGRLAYVFLPGTTVIDGHRCRGHGHDVMTQFHPGGQLKLCWLEDDEVIQGVPCARTTFLGEVFGSAPGGVSFAADGRLAGCRLSRDLASDGRVFGKGTRVGLDPAGRVRPVTWGSE